MATDIKHAYFWNDLKDEEETDNDRENDNERCIANTDVR